ncbi:hypothetical protein, partial [Proteiniphilum sp.]|uniref:hypothetical protein n=1 Tax=Proteiniphilum sp. TaxID=1926877 RepID=UPI002B20C35D
MAELKKIHSNYNGQTPSTGKEVEDAFNENFDTVKDEIETTNANLVQLAGEKADHGYASSPKTLKDVEELASAKIPNLVLNGDLHNGLTGWT